MRNRPGTILPTQPKTGLNDSRLDDDAIATKHVKNLEAIELKIEKEKYLKIFKKYLENNRNFKQY